MNNKNVWLDCVYMKHLKNNFILNVHLWKRPDNTTIYDVRIGYLKDNLETPTIILYENEDYAKIKEFLYNYLNNIKTIIFKR